MKGIFHGVIGKAKEDKKNIQVKMKLDGNGNTIGIGFLIDENGMIKTVSYGKFLHDHLPLKLLTHF